MAIPKQAIILAKQYLHAEKHKILRNFQKFLSELPPSTIADVFGKDPSEGLEVETLSIDFICECYMHLGVGLMDVSFESRITVSRDVHQGRQEMQFGVVGDDSIDRLLAKIGHTDNFTNR